jgi:predicted methyltransferase
MGWTQAAQPTEAKGKSLLETQRSAKVKAEVEKRGQQARVRVTLRDNTEVKGYISQMDPDSFQVTDKKSGRITTIAYQEVDRVRNQGMSTGAKIAVAAGIGAAVIIVLVALSRALNHS